MAFDPAKLDPNILVHVLNVTRKLSAPYDLGELLQQVIEAGREVLHADRGSVFLYDFSRRELYSTVATGEAEIRFSIERGIAGECARTRRVVNVPDCYADPRFNPEIDRKTGYRTNCLITIPLIGLDDELEGVMQLLNSEKGHFDETDERIAEVLAAQAAVAIQRARLLDERMVKLKLERDLALARQIQMQVLPKALPQLEGYDLAARSKPADQTGGDIYDVAIVNADAAPADRQLLLLLADATGHGIGPALSVTQARAMLRMGLRMTKDVDQLHGHINAQVCDDLSQGRFITALLGVLDPKTNELHYHAAGQGPVLIYRKTPDEFGWYDASTIPWGVIDPPPPYEQQMLAMEVGDIIALLTDGFYEYEDMAGNDMGRDACAEVVRQQSDRSAAEILNALFEAVRVFGGDAPQNDDLTGIIIKRCEIKRCEIKSCE